MSENIRLIHRVVGTKHVYTSPDVPELHVSHADKATAYKSVGPAIQMLKDMKARAVDRRKNMDWHDIETAPRDGKRVLVCDAFGNVECAEFIHGEWRDPYSDPLLDPPTHWMPLPDAPTP